MIELRLVDEVSWRGAPVPRGRTHAVLAALVDAGGRTVGEQALCEQVWGRDDPPANPAKALQVVVSRARTQTGADVVLRSDHGYRLGLGAPAVDVLVLREAVARARAAEASGDAVAVRDHARAVLALPAPGSLDGGGPLAGLRDDVRRLREEAGLLLGRALSALGDHDEALPLLERAGPTDEATTVALLRSLAAVQGAPAALERFEVHRAEVRDRLGIDPGPILQSLHAELLATDSPIRSGLRYDATSLVGRDDELRALRGLVQDSRVTSVVGPGGLGKTRLANLVARTASQPVVHVVELVGVTSPDDVVQEVGSALGVRDSVSGRRVLTPTERADVRSRIAAELDAAPTLLVLDNCEHVVAAVADLVAFLVATTRELRVLTTTRAPLAIAAERVFPLGQLGTDDAADLFEQRARAARPGVPLPRDVVRRVVGRLDGLPLAIELAAARTRAMSVEDVDRRLDDRFALLRAADRSAPDRHQTLLAVIGWSWDLLTPPEQAALARLALMRDGFTLETADALLGRDALGLVESLVSQSLLTVLEDGAGVRYRMLETVREFGLRELEAAGDTTAALAARRAWASGYATAARARVYGLDQVAAVRRLAQEEANLTDVLHEALAEPRPATVVAVLSALAALWTITGEHTRVITLSGAVEASLTGWEPEPEEVDATCDTASLLVLTTAVVETARPVVAAALLERYVDRVTDPRVRALKAVLDAHDLADPARTATRLTELTGSEDRAVALLAQQWLAHWLENIGDIDGATLAGEASLRLWVPDDGIWLRGLVQTQLASHHAQLGRWDLAVEYAREALVVLDSLDARDDAVQLRSVMVGGAIAAGDVDEAERLLGEMVALHVPTAFGSQTVLTMTRAEVALARGGTAEGLRLYDDAVLVVRAMRIPGLDLEPGLAPWTLYAEAAAVCAHAHLGTPPSGAELAADLTAKVADVLSGATRRLDYPVAGTVLFALGLWRLLRGPGDRDAVAALALADRFGYSRYTPILAWDRAVEQAEWRWPGELDRLAAADGVRRGPDALADARALVERWWPAYILRE